MKLVPNKLLKNLKADEIQTLDEISFILDHASPTYLKLLKQHFDYQQRVEDGIWPEVYVSAKYIAKKDVLCDEKTVHRFNADMGSVIFRRRRFKDGKQTSNVYKMNKTFYKFMKAFWKLGLWKAGTHFETQWAWIKKLWIEYGCDTTLFMNKVWSYKSLKDKGKQTSYEQAKSKMSVGFSDKCPSSSKALSITYEYSTSVVPATRLREIESLLKTRIRQAMEDVHWYAARGKLIRNFVGLFSERLCGHLRPRKV